MLTSVFMRDKIFYYSSYTSACSLSCAGTPPNLQ